MNNQRCYLPTNNKDSKLGDPQFEQHIPAAIANLTEVCAEGAAQEELRTLFAGGL